MELSRSSSSNDELPQEENGESTCRHRRCCWLSLYKNDEYYWSLPWYLAGIFLYLFAVPWMYFAIVRRYLILGEWNVVLPGMDTTLARKLCMGGHMVCGGMTMILGPFQFVPQLRRRNYFLTAHRWMGRLYVICSVLSCILGNIFIALKRGHLVGGYNMAVAFCAAGTSFGVFAFLAYYFVDKNLIRHRAWAIRSYSQCLSPMLYRYWYGAVMVLFDYNPTSSPSDDDYDDGGGCVGGPQADGICVGYLRPFDMIHVWSYWIFSLLVAEFIIWALRHDDKPATNNNVAITNDNVDLETITTNIIPPASDSTPLVRDGEEQGERQKSLAAIYINAIGVALAVVIFTVNVKLLTTT